MVKQLETAENAENCRRERRVMNGLLFSAISAGSQRTLLLRANVFRDTHFWHHQPEVGYLDMRFFDYFPEG